MANISTIKKKIKKFIYFENLVNLFLIMHYNDKFCLFKLMVNLNYKFFLIFLFIFFRILIFLVKYINSDQ